MRVLIPVFIMLVITVPAYAVPLAEWEADEAKLLGEEPVTLVDLPDEWQGLGEDGLVEQMEEVFARAEELYWENNYDQALSLYQQQLYLAYVLADLGRANTIVLDVALVSRLLGQYESALLFCLRSLELSREIGDRAAEGLALTSTGLMCDYLGRYDEALEYYSTALDISRSLADKDTEGTLLNNIGAIHNNQGHYDLALEYYAESLELSRIAGDVLGEAVSLSNQGIVYRNLGQYYRALDLFEQSLAIATEVGDLDGQAITNNNIGAIYRNLGQYGLAIEQYEKSLAISLKTKDIAGQNVTLCNMGMVYDTLGQYQLALDYFGKVITTAREIGDPMGEGIVLNSLGSVYQSLKMYDQALGHYQGALAINNGIGNVMGSATSLTNIGAIHETLGRNDEALEFFIQSLDLCREIGDVPGEGAALNNIGTVYRDLGQHGLALDYFEQHLEIIREQGDIRSEGVSLNNIGLIYDDLGQSEQALDYYNQALEIKRGIGDLAGQGISLSNIGVVYLNLDQYETALDYFLEGYRIALNQAKQFTWESGLKGGLISELYDDASVLAVLYLELGQPEDAFETIQSSKGLPLLQLLAQAQSQSRDPKVQAALDGYRNANAAIQELWQELALVADGDGRREAIGQQLEALQATATDNWDYLREHSKEITDIIEVRGLTTRQVQDNVLAENQVVLEYMVTEDEVIIFCLPKEGKLSVARAKMPDLGGTGFKDWLGRRIELLYADEPQISNQAAKALYKLLVEPVVGQIPAGADLIICPDRDLFIVPFEALMDDGYFLDKHSITYSTSATMLSYIKPSGGAEGALIAGVSFGAGEDANSALLENRSVDPVRGRFFAKNLPALPGVIDEANEIAAIYGTQPLLDEQVTEAFLREMMPGHKVIHLATHGYLSDIPLLNGVVTYMPGTSETTASRAVPMLPGGDEELSRAIPMLPGGDDELLRDIPMLPGGDDELRGIDLTINTNDDGFLAMVEVMGIPLDGCELVTLSACHSAEGEVAPGEGVMGLSQGFMYAGARSVLASLTKVDDSATRLLMVEFYQNWNSGMAKRDALRAAKQTLISAGYSAPKYWAPFVLYGVE